MEKVLGIGGVFFKARDPERLAAWYREHLGVPGEGAFGEFHASATPHRGAKTVWALFPEDTDYFAPSASSFMVNYRVENLDRMLAQLRGAGISIDKTEDHSYGRFAWLSDPEGNRIELWEAIE
jgi:predicted enzyme related to lactoylglutathione lyase